MKTITFFIVMALTMTLSGSAFASMADSSESAYANLRNPNRFIVFEVNSGQAAAPFANVSVYNSHGLIFKGTTNDQGLIYLYLDGSPYAYEPVDIVVELKDYIPQTLFSEILQGGKRYSVSLNKRNGL